MTKIKLTEKEHIHFLDISEGRPITVAFSTGGVYLNSNTETWVILELMKLRGVLKTSEHSDIFNSAIKETI